MTNNSYDLERRKLAQLITKQLEPYRFAVGGGFALELYGISQRVSRDQDWFADLYEFLHAQQRLGRPFTHCSRIAEELKEQLETHRYAVNIVRSAPLFAKLVVEKEDFSIEIDLTMHDRKGEPEVLESIRVVSMGDAVTGKLKALYDRAAPRDFLDAARIIDKENIDIYEVLFLLSGVVEHPTMEKLQASIQKLELYTLDDFLDYLSTEDELESLKQFIRNWAAL